MVSAFATRGLSADVLNLVLAEHQLVLGETVMAELKRTLTTKFRVPEATVEETLLFLRAHAAVVDKAPSLGIQLRDKDDELVLEEAVAALADVLVTGDKDLLTVAGTAPIRILTPRGLWQELRAGPEG